MNASRCEDVAVAPFDVAQDRLRQAQGERWRGLFVNQRGLLVRVSAAAATSLRVSCDHDVLRVGRCGDSPRAIPTLTRGAPRCGLTPPLAPARPPQAGIPLAGSPFAARAAA